MDEICVSIFIYMFKLMSTPNTNIPMNTSNLNRVQ